MGRTGFSAYYDVGRVRQQRLIAPEKLPEQPFDPVAHDCVARPFADGKAKPAQGQAVFAQDAFKVKRFLSNSCLKDIQKM